MDEDDAYDQVYRVAFNHGYIACLRERRGDWATMAARPSPAAVCEAFDTGYRHGWRAAIIPELHDVSGDVRAEVSGEVGGEVSGDAPPPNPSRRVQPGAEAVMWMAERRAAAMREERGDE